MQFNSITRLAVVVATVKQRHHPSRILLIATVAFSATILHHGLDISLQQFFSPRGSEFRIGDTPNAISRNDPSDSGAYDRNDAFRHLPAAIHESLPRGEIAQGTIVHIQTQVLKGTGHELR